MTEPAAGALSAQMFSQLLRELQPDNAMGLLLAAQLGNTPSELALVVRTTYLDAASGGLRPIGYYTIQMTSLAEHKLSLGPFNHAALLDDHPLLYHHNAPGVRVFVSSAAADPEALIEQIDEAHYQMFGQWRTLDGELNKRMEPKDVLTNGLGLIGEMPQPFAEAVSHVLTSHNVQHTLVESEPKIGHFKLMALDNSYFVARAFAVQSVSNEAPESE